ncbi:MAG: TonB-dependent receptor [Bacteroidetes bacterium]|nr:TonB-dependent receptor [Bacteroidota bacterium]
MRNVIVLLFCVVLAAAAQAQNIAGNIKDDQGKNTASASVTLKKAKDSAIVKLGASNAQGHYEFINVQPGKYFITVSHIGYAIANSSAFETNGSGTMNAPEIVLTKSTAGLKEVTVVSRKPIVEVKSDKIVLNVEGSVNAVGQDALELLRKSPGVMVDKDDNLSLSGKTGAQVYIDGRPTPLTGKDLSDYLKTIQSSSIESIELITNPSAKYEAAGNAGIINIKLKKNKSFGTNGTVNAGYNIGTYPKYNAGLTLNHRDAHVNLFGNYSYNNSKNEMNMFLYRTQLDTLFDQHGTFLTKNSAHNFKAGMDYFINKKSTIGVMVNGSLSDNKTSNYSRTPISYIPDNEVTKILVANNNSKSTRNNINANINYRYADTSGRELNIDGDYGRYHIRNNQMQPNYYYDPTGKYITDSNIYNMISPTDINIYSFKTDYEQNFKKGRLGLGGKTSFVTSDNNFENYNVIQTLKHYDSLRSNIFNYKENINAVYANYSRSIKNFSFQAGLRVENTNASGHSNGYKLIGDYVVYDSTFDKHYTDFFPSAGITYKKNPMKQWSLNYSRRIDRPSYQDLNPFEFRLDEYTYQKGNTALQPQYTNSIGLTYMYKYRLTTTLNYSHVSNVFTQLVDTADKSKAFITKKNLATQDITSLNISYPFQYKWYSVFGNLNTFYSKYNANFGAGRTVNLDVFAFTFYAQNSFRLGKGWTGELSGWYASPSIWQGTFKTKQIWSVDGGLQKTVLNGKGNIKASVSDIFNALHWNATSDFAGQHINARGNFESRQFKLNFTYRFGNNQVKASRQRKTGTDDENQRVGSQGSGLNASK